MASTLGQAVRDAATRLAGFPTPMLDARILVRHALGVSPAEMIARDNEALTEEQRRAVDALLQRRLRHEPVAYIVGRKEFWGLEFETAPGVLVPRPDTETLVSTALDHIDARAFGRRGAVRILDLGVGTGAVLGALLSELPNARGVGVDINPVASAVAARNLARLGLARRAIVLTARWGLACAGPFDLLVSNPPYIPEADRACMPRDVVDFEDPRALFAGADGLDAYRAILADAPRLMAPDAALCLEIGDGVSMALTALVEARFPGAAMIVSADLSGAARALRVAGPAAGRTEKRCNKVDERYHQGARATTGSSHDALS